MKPEGYEYAKQYSSHEHNIPFNKEHYSNLPLAKIASGREKNNDNSKTALGKEKELVKMNSFKKTQMTDSNKEMNNNDSKGSLSKQYQHHQLKTNTSFITSTFVNKIGSHNSYLGAVIHSLYYMTNYRDYILNEIEEIDLNHYPLISKLKQVFLKYSSNKRIDLTSLSQTLADVYSTKKAFVMNKPEDVIDCLFAFINFMHSIHITCPLSEASDISCNRQCFSHKELWLNIAKIDECECTAINNEPCSKHNYITEIPLDTIIHYVNKKGIYESSQRLFRMFNHIIQNTKVLCPLNGRNCNFCITKRSLCLIQPLPQYLIFSYERQSYSYSSSMSISDILKSMIVIPKYYDFTHLFSGDTSTYSKILYELYGFVFIKPSKCYTCAFKCGNEIDSNINWVYYDDDNVFTLFSLVDLISLCMKNGLMPVLFYYTMLPASSHEISKTSRVVNCTVEECKRLEAYAYDIDSFNQVKERPLRVSDCLYEKDKEIQRNTSHRKIHSHAVRTTSKTKSNKIMNDDDGLSEYICVKCQTNNRIECILCPTCGESNEKTIEDTIRRRRKVMDLPFAKNHITKTKVASIPSGYKEEKITQVTNEDIKPSNLTSVTTSTNTNPVNPYKREKKQQTHSKEGGEPKNYDLPMQLPLKPNETTKTNNNQSYNTNHPTESDAFEKLYQDPSNLRSTDNQQEHSRLKTHHNFCINTNYHSNKNQLINISDSSSRVSEDRIKLYIEKKDSNTPSNYANISNHTKVISYTKPQTAQKPPSLPEMWICSNCEKVNKAIEYKCLVCGLINKKQRELIELNDKHINKSTENNFTPTARDISSMNQIQLTAPSHTVNLNTTFKKVSCLCYSSSRSNIIKNGVCTVCHRVIDLMTSVKKSSNVIDKEIVYKPPKSGKDKTKDTSSEMTIKIQSTKKQVTTQNRYDNEEVNCSTNQMIRNVKISKDVLAIANNTKRPKSEQCYKKLAQRKNK